MTSTDTGAAATDPAVAAKRPPFVLAWLLIIGGLLGLLASFELTMDYITVLKNPTATLSCSLNVTVDCGKNIGAWQGSVFGFPNPVLGLMMFVAPVAVGVSLLAGAKFKAWFWWLFDAGMWFAIIFIGWLAYQSFFNLGTLCPWCALVYVVVVPMWLAVTVHTLSEGHAGQAAKKVGSALQWWLPLLTILGYVIIFGAAQLRLGVIQSFL